MEFEYPLFENKAQAFLDFEGAQPENDKNEDEYSEPMKAFYCTHAGCKKSFRYRSEILRHMVTHTAKRPYVCTYKNCMKGFKRSDALATHMRIHTREKTFECPYGSCKSTFSTKAGLKYHTLKHKSEKRSMNYAADEKEFIAMENEVNTNGQGFSQELFIEGSMEAPMESFNFQEQYPMGENQYNAAFDSAHFDTTQVQQIAPFNFGEKAVYQEKNEYDTYLSNYSTTPSNVSYNKEADAYPNYHFTNSPQNVMNCAFNIINPEDINTLSKTSSLNSLNSKAESGDKLFDMMHKIVEENSNLKKQLDFFSRFMRGSQFPAEEQNGIF